MSVAARAACLLQICIDIIKRVSLCYVNSECGRRLLLKVIPVDVVVSTEYNEVRPPVGGFS